MSQHPDILDKKAAAAALVALAEHGVPPDVQELLVFGNPSQGIAPGALSKVVKAVLRAYGQEVACGDGG